MPAWRRCPVVHVVWGHGRGKMRDEAKAGTTTSPPPPAAIEQVMR
jgi:hypothetical protein